jgi:hypothetical protein
MVPVSAKQVGVIALVAAMAASTLVPLGGALGAQVATVGPSGSPASASNVSAPPASVPPSPPPGLVANPGSLPSNPAGAMATTALAQARAAGVSPTEVFLPRPSATPRELSESRRLGLVQPLYTSSPAPMGLAYYGLGRGPGGRVVASEVNTTSLVGTVVMNATGIRADDLYQASPDSYAIQLNAVLTNVTLFGQGGYSFWAQNVVEYYPTTGFVVLVTNIWNFSGGSLSAGDFYKLGVHGKVIGTEFYADELALGTPTTPAPKFLPFTVTLWLNSSVVGGRDALNFTVQLTSSTYWTEDVREPYDSVVFNSLPAHGGTPISVPAQFTANGRAYNPLGLTDDFELTVGGPGGGSQATLLDADATLGLAYRTVGAFVGVPSAYSYGGDTAETSTGATVTWSLGSAGDPFSFNLEYGTMHTGPAILTGLWGAGGTGGSAAVGLNLDPANAFVLVAPSGAAANFTVNASEVAPTAHTATLYLAPGNYTLTVELSDYDPSTTPLNVTGPMTVTVDLVPDLSSGVYTPLWAFSNAGLAALATSGSGTVTSPYVLPNDQPAPLAPVFGLYNTYGFPAYPGVFLQNTTATTELVDPPSFATVTNVTGPEASGLPSQNDLQYWFWNASNVALLNAPGISGWFAATTFFPAAFNTFSVIFYASTSDLVANDTFASGSGGLLVYASVLPLAPTVPLGGSATTIWGNLFEPLSRSAVCAGRTYCNVTATSLELGLELAGSGNTVYNNEFLTPTTAWLVPMSLYTGVKQTHADLFNITPEPASDVHTVPAFPSVDLTGSIVGTAEQGGNYWWDYGLAFNPYNGASDPFGVLPYVEKALTYLDPARGYYPPGFYYASFLYPGGDFAPLVPYPLFSVTLEVRGLPKAADWTLAVRNASGTEFVNLSQSGTSRDLELPNGGYAYTVAVAGAHFEQTSGTFAVNGSALKAAATFYTVSWKESGLPKGHTWTLTFNGTVRVLRSTPYPVYLGNGTYPYLVQSPGGYVFMGIEPGSITVSGGSFTATMVFARGPSNDLAFREKGLAKGTTWCVQVSVSTVCTTKGLIHFLGLPSTVYPYNILTRGLPNVSAKISGASVPHAGTIDLTHSTLVSLVYGEPFPVRFTEVGLPPSESWSVTIGTTTYTNQSGVPTSFVLLNGTYSYKVQASGPSIAGPEKGKFVVDGSARRLTLTWYPITFTEKGLANGTSWCVKVGVGSSCSTNTSIVVYEGNGTYGYHVDGVKGYTVAATPTKASVQGAGASVSVTFKAPTVRSGAREA